MPNVKKRQNGIFFCQKDSQIDSLVNESLIL